MSNLSRKIKSFWNILFRYIYPFFKGFQVVLSVTSPLIVAFFLIVSAYFITTNADQFSDLFIAMMNDWWYKFTKKSNTTALWARDGSFLIALCLLSFSLTFGSRWVLLKSTIRPVRLRTEFHHLRRPLRRLRKTLLLYAPRVLGFLPFLVIAVAFNQTRSTIKYQHASVWYWILIVLSLGILVSVGLLTVIRKQLVKSVSPTDSKRKLNFAQASASTQAHQIKDFPLFRKWVIVLVALNLILTLFFGFVHRLQEWLNGGEYPVKFDLATWVGFGTIFITALAGWGLLLMWLRFQLRRRAIPLLGFLVVFASVVYLVGINIKRRTIRTLAMPAVRSRDSTDVRQPDSTYVDQWLISRKNEAVDTIPVFIVAAEGGGSRAAHWTSGVLARLDADLPGFRRHLLAISGVSGGSVGAGFYLSWLKTRPNEKNVRQALDSLTSADFLSGLIGAFCYPDPLTSFIPFVDTIPIFDRARWLEDRFSNQFYTVTQQSTLTEGFLKLTSRDTTLPLLLINSTVVETGKKAIISPVRLDSNYFYEARDVLRELNKDIPMMTAMGLSSRFPVVTPAGTVHGLNLKGEKISYRLVDGGYFENTGMQTAYQLLQLVMNRREILGKKGSLNNKIFKPIIVFIENGDTRVSDSPEAETGFAPIAAFYKAWDHRTPSVIGDMKYFVSQVIDRDGFQLFQLKRTTERVLPLGWYLSETARQSINDQVQGIDQGNSYQYIRKVLGKFNPPAVKSRAPERRIDEKIDY
jgi:predicted acylesterase/phospholipase RssA